NRYEEKCFVAEGSKTVEDLLSSFVCRAMYGTESYIGVRPDCFELVTHAELKSISNLETPQDVLAVFEMHENKWDFIDVSGKLSLALENIQDAGNLGTIIRVADWFGIENIMCSIGTVDVYNCKTVQATMGALARVNVYYGDLKTYLMNLSSQMPIYATTLDGTDVYAAELSKNGVIVMGNEGNGISSELKQICNSKLLIPSYPQGRKTSESLNVGIATAVICSEFRRRR
ncbi:MAG: RNA methyltransferase, partial [Bacteroidia bacterium]|nr:RNA methyltransferase [Bacteroidia bacterium]